MFFKRISASDRKRKSLYFLLTKKHDLLLHPQSYPSEDNQNPGRKIAILREQKGKIQNSAVWNIIRIGSSGF